MTNTTQSTESLYTLPIRLKDVEDFRKDRHTLTLGDRRDGKIYRYQPDIKLAVNVAFATGRPLLVLGPSGCGKSSLAFNLARKMKRRYYEYVVTSRSEAIDLFYRFDVVRRLGDAHCMTSPTNAKCDTQQLEYHRYIEPGPLWWIYDPAGAVQRGCTTAGADAAADPARWPSPDDTAKGMQANAPAVLLIDEIDKAEPDFPNNLLVPIGSREFWLAETSQRIPLQVAVPPLVIITSNQERALPEAFVRRCVVLKLPIPTLDDLVTTARAVNPQLKEKHCREVGQKLVDLRGADRLSIAEYLDALVAIEQLQAEVGAWDTILLKTTWREGEG
ncbi:MAG: AAA family ATPase [Armatimonadota bacterium]